MGLRPLKEIHVVNELKLIWRILSGKSLWSKWVHKNLIKQRNFWELNGRSQLDSWMWKKILTLRDRNQNFYTVEIGNGRNTFFWYDCWSELGVVSKLLGDRGVTDMGIRKSATVEEALLTDGRRRRQRTHMLNKVEEVLRLTHDPEKGDTSLWRSNTGYKTQFSPQET